MSKTYSSPTVTTVGTVAQMTQQNHNKVGLQTDAFTPTTLLVGSIVPAP